jgi:hypothetical protein
VQKLAQLGYNILMIEPPSASKSMFEPTEQWSKDERILGIKSLFQSRHPYR